MFKLDHSGKHHRIYRVQNKELMGLHSLQHIAVSGISACVPSKQIFTSDYPFFSEQEKRDFAKHVGVQSKRHSAGKLTASDLCYQAAEKIISELNWHKEEIGLLILVTQSADYLMPSTAIVLQDKLKLSKKTLAFDINLGCSGWVYGLSVAGSLMQSLKISKALLLTGETSVLADYKDKGSFPLLGDAGTATALTYSDQNAEMYFNLMSDGSRYDAIIASDSGSRYLSLNGGGKQNINYTATLNGQKVLEFCLKEIIPSVESLLNFSGAKIETIDYFVFHQANKIINENLRKKLGVSPEKFPYSIGQFGNTSSASVPLTIVTNLQTELSLKPLSLLCSGFGVGLSWGSVLIRTSKVVCTDLIEIE